MNSEVMFEVQETIDEVIELMGDQYQYDHIDKPIQNEAAKFKFDTNTPMDYPFFNRTIGNFIGHICKDGLRVGHTLTAEHAQSEAFFILEHHYQGAYAQGFHAAYLDASNPDTDGLESVMAQITEIIILKERSKHVRWVLATRISSKDWHTKCLIAEILLDRWKSYLPPNILACPPAQIADNLPDLFNLFIATDRVVNKMLTGDTPLHGL